MTSANIATLPGVNPNLPSAMQPLVEIAYNLFWSFHEPAQEVFRLLDPVLWDRTGHSPVRMLVEISGDRWQALALDDKLVARINAVRDELRKHLADPGWFGAQKDASDKSGFLAAYFCAEFGLHESFQIYSGGLGLLAGDHLKSASELGLPLVGVGLLYRNGYFHQKLGASGMQQELFPPLDAPRQPVKRVMDLETGRQLTVGVHMPGREVRCAVWRADVGSVRLYLLDTNLSENAPEDREITANLYLGDQNRRIQQEIVLGIGGVRALNAIGEKATVYHLNEGHAAFLAVERIREIRERTGMTFDQAREAVSASHVFTTHTPVPAGIDRFPAALMTHYFGAFCQLLGLDMEGFLALGRENVGDKAEAFSMAILAIRCCKFANGVSKLHGDVSRRMWRNIWPMTPQDDVPIGHVTNGVNTATWASPIMASLFDEHLGSGWRTAPQNPASWSGVSKISDAKLWAARNACRDRFSAFCRSMAGYARTGGMLGQIDPTLLTIGFARRFAGYKRGTLLLRDPERLTRLLRGKEGGAAGGVQLIISGKSHPGDSWGKNLIRDVVEFARSEKAGGRVLFIEDYDIDVAREMVRGCDVWLNTPIRGLEASGTSGMKAAINGVLHASILDGWWDEGFAPDVGYKIADSGIYPSDEPNEKREAFESDALYSLIERELVPDFYNRTQGVPTKWTARVRGCIAKLAPEFSTHRMVAEYATNFYFPAHAASKALAVNNFAPARELADHVDRYRKNWSSVRVKTTECAPAPGGEGFAVAAAVRLGMIRPDEVHVQIYHGVLDNQGQIDHGQSAPMVCKQPLAGGDGSYHYSGTAKALPNAAGAKYGLFVRVLPGDTRLVNPFIPGLIANGATVLAESDPGAHL